MPDSLNAGLTFLVSTLFDFSILVLLLRMILQWVGANYYDPISQLIIKLTDPIILPMRKMVPRFHQMDLSILILLILLELLKLLCLIGLQAGMLPNFFGLFIWSVGDLLNHTVNVFFYCIIIMVLMSWFPPGSYSSFVDLLHEITEPLLRPIRRFMPSLGGFDLSAIPAMIGLKLIAIVLIQPIVRFGVVMAIGSTMPL
ncbi:MAG: YggT family protein [Proteobacteria bacterium]|nr:YggT family protein [Pseudomonadota bacterium]